MNKYKILSLIILKTSLEYLIEQDLTEEVFQEWLEEQPSVNEFIKDMTSNFEKETGNDPLEIVIIATVFSCLNCLKKSMNLSFDSLNNELSKKVNEIKNMLNNK